MTHKTIQEYGSDAPPAKLISVRTQSSFPSEWEGQLSGILTRSTGYDHVRDYVKKFREPIPCGYLPLYCNRAVAEQAILLMLALLRKLPQQTKQMKNFHRDEITGRECLAKNLLVIGIGNIGYEIVKFGRGIAMNVRGIDISQKHKDVDYTTPAEGIPWADIIITAMNLNETNDRYLNHERMAPARNGVVVVNIARGEFTPATDMLNMLESGKVGALAMDVYPEEKAFSGKLRDGTKSDNAEIASLEKMMCMNNVIFTPHNAFNTEESVLRKSEQSVESAITFLRDGTFPNQIPLS